jgi:methylenetetrahydrofolate dehydrogenase (NADP+)/methenyltetrahydrofolate cyclohydrolase
MVTTARVLDGKKLANEIKAKLASQIKSENLQLGLGTILVGSDPSSHSYVAGKHRIKSIRVELPESASESEILSAVAKLNADSSCSGFIVQLPLPKGVSSNKVLESIDPSKDADGLHALNLGKLTLQQSAPLPCTPKAIFELVSQNGISWEGKNVIIVGRGTTVGRPLGLLLSGKVANATVTIAHSKTDDLISHLKRAEIIVAALGKPNFLKSEMVKDGAVVIDVGLTRIGDKLVGDVDPSVYEKVSAYSPVPGGVGPLTRAMLLSNVLELARKSFN